MDENGDDEVSRLLHSWGLSDLKTKFKANYIIMQALEYLTEEDIVELIPKIGQRAIFRGRLLKWRQENGIMPTVPLKICKQEPITHHESVSKLQNTNETSSPNQFRHKIFGTLTKCIQKPKIISANTPKSAMQSKVKQFYISPHGEASAPPHDSVPTPAPSTSPNIIKPDLTPFVTSIIRVETNCDKTYQNTTNTQGNATPAAAQPTKVSRTTILQKLNNLTNAISTVGNQTNKTRAQVSEDEEEDQQPDARHLYPIVKLETEATNSNWNEFNGPEPDCDQQAEPERQGIKCDPVHFQQKYAESIESDSVQEFDSENERAPKLLERIAPAFSRKKQIKFLPKTDVRYILMSTDLGQHVLNYYETNEHLDLGRRRMLIDALIQHCCTTRKRIGPKDCAEMADEIIKVFPNERKEYYYVANPGKTIKSPLYNKYRNYFKRNMLEKSSPAPIRKKRKSRRIPKIDSIEIDDDIIIS